MSHATTSHATTSHATSHATTSHVTTTATTSHPMTSHATTSHASASRRDSRLRRSEEKLFFFSIFVHFWGGFQDHGLMSSMVTLRFRFTLRVAIPFSANQSVIEWPPTRESQTQNHTMNLSFMSIHCFIYFRFQSPWNAPFPPPPFITTGRRGTR